MEEYHRVFLCRYKSNVPRCQQLVAAEFMASGRWEKHLRKIFQINRKKRDVLIQTIKQNMGERVAIHGHNAGLHLLLEFTGGKSERVSGHGLTDGPVLV